MDKVKIGVLGAGAISGIYFKNLTKVFTEVEIVAVCDLFVQKAKEAAVPALRPQQRKDSFLTVPDGLCYNL